MTASTSMWLFRRGSELTPEKRRRTATAKTRRTSCEAERQTAQHVAESRSDSRGSGRREPRAAVHSYGAPLPWMGNPGRRLLLYLCVVVDPHARAGVADQSRGSRTGLQC